MTPSRAKSTLRLVVTSEQLACRAWGRGWDKNLCWTVVLFQILQLGGRLIEEDYYGSAVQGRVVARVQGGN